jgi:glycosyltransferase involved in cell wall biosynthesis
MNRARLLPQGGHHDEGRFKLSRTSPQELGKHMRQLIVDDRWRGEHGIGRFATEVVGRLNRPWRSLGGESSPTAVTDWFNGKRLRLRSNETLYNPGFNAGFTRARQVLTIHDLIHLQIPTERSWAKTIYYNTIVRWAVRRAGVVITVSAASASAVKDWLKSASVRIVVVGCGRSDAFTIVGRETEFERPTFVYVGNLKPHKNVDVLLGALTLRPSYRLVVVTSDIDEARQRISAAGLSDRVSVRSSVPDVELAEIYRGAAGALQPSLLEGFGLPVLEAMSCGTRVAFWAGCESVREICAGTGVEVKSSTDAPEWAIALDQLIEAREAGRLNMPASWQTRYEWDTVASKVGQALDAAS